MARKRRDYAAEYARRQSLARERGYKSYYDQRVHGGAGAFVPGVLEPGQAWGAPGGYEEAPMLPNDAGSFEDALQDEGVAFVSIRGKYSGTIVADIVYSDGSEALFTLQQPPQGYTADPGTADDAYSFIEGWADWMEDNDIDYDIEVSP